MSAHASDAAPRRDASDHDGRWSLVIAGLVAALTLVGGVALALEWNPFARSDSDLLEAATGDLQGELRVYCKEPGAPGEYLLSLRRRCAQDGLLVFFAQRVDRRATNIPFVLLGEGEEVFGWVANDAAARLSVSLATLSPGNYVLVTYITDRPMPPNRMQELFGITEGMDLAARRARATRFANRLRAEGALVTTRTIELSITR